MCFNIVNENKHKISLLKDNTFIKLDKNKDKVFIEYVLYEKGLKNFSEYFCKVLDYKNNVTFLNNTYSYISYEYFNGISMNRWIKKFISHSSFSKELYICLNLIIYSSFQMNKKIGFVNRNLTLKNILVNNESTFFDLKYINYHNSRLMCDKKIYYNPIKYKNYNNNWFKYIRNFLHELYDKLDINKKIKKYIITNIILFYNILPVDKTIIIIHNKYQKELKLPNLKTNSNLFYDDNVYNFINKLDKYYELKIRLKPIKQKIKHMMSYFDDESRYSFINFINHIH